MEVFLRTHASAAVVESLRELVARARRLEDAIDATVEVETWSSVRPAIEELSDSGASISLTVDAFRSWADREGYTLRPGFDRRETPSMLGRRASEIRVPNVCVAVYEDDELRCVAPCTDEVDETGEADEDRTYTVERCLAALKAGVTEPFAGRDEPRPKGFEETIERPAEEGE